MPPRQAAAAPERGRRLPADDRKLRILEAAQHIFSTRGFATSNVADICAAAGIARGTFYLYFDSKPAILMALLHGVEERVKTVMGDRMPLEGALFRLKTRDAATVLGFCEARLGEILAAVFSDEKSLRVVMREARAAGGIIEETIARIDDVILAALERDLRIAQNGGLFRPGNTRIIARYILGGVEKILLLALAKDEPIDLAEIIRETVQIELFGLLSDEVRRWR